MLVNNYTREFFDKFYESENPWKQNGLNAYCSIKKFLPSIDMGFTAAEIGSGEGVVSYHLLNNFKHLHCCEISKVASDRAKELLKGIEGVDILCCDFVEAKLPVVDYIIAQNVLYYSDYRDDYKKCIKKLNEATGKNSMIIIMESFLANKKQIYSFKPDNFELLIYEKHAEGGGFGIWIWKKIE